jgi:hypothetical protein
MSPFASARSLCVLFCFFFRLGEVGVDSELPDVSRFDDPCHPHRPTSTGLADGARECVVLGEAVLMSAGFHVEHEINHNVKTEAKEQDGDKTSKQIQRRFTAHQKQVNDIPHKPGENPSPQIATLPDLPANVDNITMPELMAYCKLVVEYIVSQILIVRERMNVSTVAEFEVQDVTGNHFIFMCKDILTEEPRQTRRERAKLEKKEKQQAERGSDSPIGGTGGGDNGSNVENGGTQVEQMCKVRKVSMYMCMYACGVSHT